MRRNGKSVGVFLAMLCLAGLAPMARGVETQPASTPAAANTPREIAKRVSPSVVLLVMEDRSGQPLAMGSGFVVREGVVATNLHVIEGAARGYAKLADQKAKYDIRGIVASDSARDLVLLAVDGLKAASLAVGNSSQVAVGDEVFAVGNPRGLEGTFSAGIVSSIRKRGDDSLLQITAPISPGSSGGPVVNTMGEVIGVAVATFKGGQNLNFAIPSVYVSSLTSTIKAAVPLAKDSNRPKDPKTKSLFDDLGGRSIEGVAVGSFLWTYPGSPVGFFSFSLRNQLRDPIKNVLCVVVFYDKDGAPIETHSVAWEGIILPGLAKRMTGQVDGSVQKIAGGDSDAVRTKIEYRVLYFDLVTDDEPKDKQIIVAPEAKPDVGSSVIDLGPVETDGFDKRGSGGNH